MGGDERSLDLDIVTHVNTCASTDVAAVPASRPAVADRIRQPRDDRRTDAARLAAGPVHGHRGPSRRCRLRAGRDRRPVDRRGLRGLARLLHERRRRAARIPTSIRSSWRRCARRSSGRRPRSSATRASRSSISPTAPWPTTSRSASCSSARSGRSGPTRSWPTTPRSSFYRDGGINHTDHRAAGIAAVDAVYPAARNPMAFPWLARSGLAAHNVRRLYLFWPNQPDVWVDVSATIDRKIEALRAHAARSRSPEQLERADPRVGEGGGRVGRRGGGRGAPPRRHRRGRGRARARPTPTRPLGGAGPTHEHAATAARSPDTTT